jgi:hypothetical protein
VKGELLEDIALARALHKPIPTTREPSPFLAGCFMASGMMRCRMYGSWEAFRRGWKRIYAESARRYPKPLRHHAARLRLTGLVLPAGAVLAIAVGAVAATDRDGLAIPTAIAGVAAIVSMLAALTAVYRTQRTPLRWVVLYPIGAWYASRLLFEAATDLERDHPTEWAGRSYQRKRPPKHHAQKSSKEHSA